MPRVGLGHRIPLALRQRRRPVEKGSLVISWRSRQAASGGARKLYPAPRSVTT